MLIGCCETFIAGVIVSDRASCPNPLQSLNVLYMWLAKGHEAGFAVFVYSWCWSAAHM